MQIIIIQGSESDSEWSYLIYQSIEEATKQQIEIKTLSAHKQGKELLEFLERQRDRKTIYVTVAGRSNALSGFVAGNTKAITIACPPLVAKADLPIDIWSTLRMPSNVPAMTILEPSNVGLAIKRILDLKKD